MNNRYVSFVLALFCSILVCTSVLAKKGLLLASRDELDQTSIAQPTGAEALASLPSQKARIGKAGSDISTEHNAGSKNSPLTNGQTSDQDQQGAASTVASNAADTKIAVPVSTKKSVLLADDQGDQ